MAHEDDWGWIGDCEECGAPFERVRPGKTQPTCDCPDRCANEGCNEMRGQYSAGEIARNMSGFLCPVCDADETEMA